MFLTENNKSADLDQSINQSINVNCFNFLCFYFEYLVLLLTLLSLLRIELWLWLSFLGKGKF